MPKGAMRILAADQKNIVMSVPSVRGEVRKATMVKVLGKKGQIAICCDTLSCSVKNEALER